jgi:hypothetical protein
MVDAYVQGVLCVDAFTSMMGQNWMSFLNDGLQLSPEVGLGYSPSPHPLDLASCSVTSQGNEFLFRQISSVLPVDVASLPFDCPQWKEVVLHLS